MSLQLPLPTVMYDRVRGHIHAGTAILPVIMWEVVSGHICKLQMTGYITLR